MYVDALAQVRSEMGLRDDQYSLTALMGAAGREGDAATVWETFQLAWNDGISSTFMCNTAMSGLARAGDAEVRSGLCWCAGRHRA